MNEQKQPLHVVGGTTHATEAELLRLRAEIDLRDVQQTAIAELGQAALTGVDPHMLLGQACALIEMTLGVEHCRALEITAADDVIFATGSLYLVGDLRRHWDTRADAECTGAARKTTAR